MSEALDQHLDKKYEQGFTTDVESMTLPPGLDETTVEKISQFKKEPQWLLDWRLRAFARWKAMEQPNWSELDIEPIDYQSISYYSAPKPKLKSMDEVDPEVLATFEKLGIPTQEQAALAGVAAAAQACAGLAAVFLRKSCTSCTCILVEKREIFFFQCAK